MHKFTIVFCISAISMAFSGVAQDVTSPPVSAATATAASVNAKGLEKLRRLVREFIADEEVVGAELMVLKKRHVVLHDVFGRRDLEADLPMEKNAVFCVRSMTKPVIGTAILMLIADGRLAFDDRVATHIPAFDVDGSREITVEHLLTHTSGLPMSLLVGRDLAKLEGIGAVAALGAGHELRSRPGAKFRYSDQGTDTLTALIEVVTEGSAADFVRTRVLKPLGMESSTCVMTAEHPLRGRASSAHIGTTGSWKRFWSPTEPPLFPFFLGSQGLYSTVADYARFMDFWRHEGRVGQRRLLDAKLVRRALTPHLPSSSLGMSGMAGLSASYGYLMQLWTTASSNGGSPRVAAFGHGGSDGTYAWTFPDEEITVLYFTQSRNNRTAPRLEAAIGEIVFGAKPDAPVAAPPVEAYLGYYREDDNDLYRAIVRDGDDLALEILGKQVVPLTYAGDDRWKMRPNPGVVLEFQRSKDGAVTGFRIGNHQEHRFTPSPDLLDVATITAKVVAAYRLDRLEKLGAIRMKGKLKMRGVEGTTSSVFAWPNRFRYDADIGGGFERGAYDGKRVTGASSESPAKLIEGRIAESTRRESPFIRFGDWREEFADLRVIQRLQRGGRDVVLVRTGDTSAPATTYYVEVKTGLILRERRMMHVAGLGRIGRSLTFADYRDVSGMKLPFRSRSEIANPMVGIIKIDTLIDSVEVGIEVSDATFDLLK